MVFVTWKVTTVLEIAAFILAASSANKPWLRLYFMLAAASVMTWYGQDWALNTQIRPVLLFLQAMAILESVDLMHRGCLAWLRRLAFARFAALSAIAGTFDAFPYPGFPVATFWAQLWLNVAGFTGCLALVILFFWWRSFEPNLNAVRSVSLFGAYCGVHLFGLVYHGPGNWLAWDTAGMWLKIVVLIAWANLQIDGMFNFSWIRPRAPKTSRSALRSLSRSIESSRLSDSRNSSNCCT